MRMMTEEEIPDFVRDVAATGCDIRAVGSDSYVFGDADLSWEVYQKIEPELKRIADKYGSRDHLFYHIVHYLHSIGRSYPPPVIQ
jgi:hypothetical protein